MIRTPDGRRREEGGEKEERKGRRGRKEEEAEGRRREVGDRPRAGNGATNPSSHHHHTTNHQPKPNPPPTPVLRFRLRLAFFIPPAANARGSLWLFSLLYPTAPLNAIGEEEERKRRRFARNLRTVAILMFAPIAKAHAGFFLGYMDPPRRGSSKDLACL